MAFKYRGPQPPPEEAQYSNFSTNPLSPQRSSNRLSGGIINSSQDARGSLARRFTTNAVPTLSPIGQQRRQAAGEAQMVRTISSDVTVRQAVGGKAGMTRICAGVADGVSEDIGAGGGVGDDLVGGSEPSPRYLTGTMIRGGGASCLGVYHGRATGYWRSNGDGRPIAKGVYLDGGSGRSRGGFHSVDLNADLSLRRLISTNAQPPNGYGRIPTHERRLRHIEALLEQQRKISAELEQVDDETRREIEDGLRHERNINQFIAQSEPTTPPEYQDAFPSVVSRPNRYSTASLTSPPGISNRANRSSIHLTSPSAGLNRPYTASTNPNLPSQSVPGSRRQSDDEEDDEEFLFGYDTTIHRAAANPNRNSMPVTSYDRKRNAADLSSALGPLNTTSFLFDDDEKPAVLPNKSSTKTSPPDTKTYLQVQHTADGFPKLIRRDDNGELASGSSAALDLALSHGPTSEQRVTDRATGNRHRVSLPPSALSSNGNIAPLNSILANANDVKSAAHNRRSVEVKFTAETKRPSLMASPPHQTPNGGSKAQSSYSTNDIPTLKSISDENSGGVLIDSPSSQQTILADTSSSDQNTSTVSRVTSGSIPNNITRQNQDVAPPSVSQEHNVDHFNSSQAGLQANATPFGPGQSQDHNHMPSYPSSNMPYGQQPYYPGYGMQTLNNGFNNMNLGGGYGAQQQWPPNQIHAYQQGGYGGYQQPFGQGGQVAAGAGRYAGGRDRTTLMQQKDRADWFYNHTQVSDISSQIYGLCKDQHGCRYLQRKLEEDDAGDVQIIFNEVKGHFIELMTDPFGNYLCQRLLEHANDQQRTVLIQNVMPDMKQIALNQHGTRALQRMIEFLSTGEQTNLIIEALHDDVVQLIQDINGNHVIQKCLNHLSSYDAEFIFNAVGINCVTVGTHRHGCCVLQRCVDHATGQQRGALVEHIINNAQAMVQDPFGNYVVQYILDLSEPDFTQPLCYQFQGTVAMLSRQKFSSNVIEKCIRCAKPETVRMLVQEIIMPSELDRLIRDSFANYVVQTAMDFSDDETKALLIESIRPMLPAIRHTPYGRRIQSKITDYDTGYLGIAAAAMPTSPDSMSPVPMAVAPLPYSGLQPPAGRGNRMGMIGAPPQWSNNNNAFGGAPAYSGNDNIVAPAPQRNQAYDVLNGTQNYPNHQIQGGNNQGANSGAGPDHQQNQGYNGPNGPQNYPNGPQNHQNQGYGGHYFGMGRPGYGPPF